VARRRFSERDTIRTLLIQGVKINCYRSGEEITLENVGTVEREHLVTIALGGPDEPDNCRYSLSAAHKVQTYGTKATALRSDRHGNDKAKRIARGGKTIKHPMPKVSREIQGRKFQPTPEGYKHRWMMEKRT
jgi:hypothetical protein